MIFEKRIFQQAKRKLKNGLGRGKFTLHHLSHKGRLREKVAGNQSTLEFFSKKVHTLSSNCDQTKLNEFCGRASKQTRPKIQNVFYSRGMGNRTPSSSTPRTCATITLYPGNKNFHLIFSLFSIVFRQLVQMRILFPAKFLKDSFFISKGIFTHCKLGYFLFLVVGLYFPRSFILRPKILLPFPQIEHCFFIYLILTRVSNFDKIMLY